MSNDARPDDVTIEGSPAEGFWFYCRKHEVSGIKFIDRTGAVMQGALHISTAKSEGGNRHFFNTETIIEE
jgi:hypothetical protein